MQKFVTLPIKEKGKTTMNEWGNDDADKLWALCSWYKKVRLILFPNLLVNLFKQRYTKSVKRYGIWTSS